MALFNYNWRLSDGYPAAGIDPHGLKVFGTFICGGGSSMGYKLAGYNHLGGVELDDAISKVYEANHHPKHLYKEDIRVTCSRTDLPEELFNLDIFDGSPPCSTFSMAGTREDGWGVEKIFAEGQALQRLDDLFFDYLRMVEKLRPKVAIAENVTGMVKGNAKAYVHAVAKEFNRIGYQVQLFNLNAASMGVPQARERIFFIARRNDLNFQPLRLSFREPAIHFGAIEDQVTEVLGKRITDVIYPHWKKSREGRPLSKVHPKGHYFNSYKASRNKVMVTIAANDGARYIHYKYPNRISDDCLKLIGSFPMDYNFLDVRPQYLIGMSVPPVMIAQIAHQVYKQWFSKN